MRTQQALASSSVASDVLQRPWWAAPLTFIYFLSGLTGVAYEVLWVRMLGLQFGVSIFGVIVTVAAFMAGLGVGSMWGAVLGARLRRPLLFFAVLEGAVALYALAMPGMFHQLNIALSTMAVGASLSLWYVLQGTVSFLVLFVPAMAMGIGFSLILRTLRSTRTNVSKLYGFNTLGGALGALLPLVLLPPMGWSYAMYVIVMFGLMVAATALLLSLICVPPSSPEAKASGDAPRPVPAKSDLLWYAGIGAAALMLEVGWTRLYGMIFLRTEYVLAVILCVFLIGIGVGSLVVRGRSAPALLKWLPVVAAVFVLIGLWAFPLAAAWADGHQDYGSLGTALLRQGLVIMALTLPVTILLGAWLPLLSNRLEMGGHISGAWLYGANSAGAACGALVGGFLLIPWLGTTGTIVFAALLMFVCGLAIVRAKKPAWILPLLILLVWPVWSLPPVNKMLPVTLPKAHNLAVYEDALMTTHVAEQADGQRLLLADLRRMDASSDPTAVVVQKNQARLPLLLHPGPSRVLFLGLGTGVTAAGALPFPNESLTAVEVSRGAINAARQWFSPVNDGVMEKMSVVRDDARRFLFAGKDSYDVIIGDLFHPDLVGRGNLLSVQEFHRAHDRLAPGGVFVQWLALNQFDLRSLRIVLRSFRQAFPGAMLFMDGFRLAMVGPKDSLRDVAAVTEALGHMSVLQQAQATGGEGVWTWLGRYWGRIPADRGLVEDEWRPQVEFLLPRARYNGGVNLGEVLDYLLETRPGLSQAEAELRIVPNETGQFEKAYIAAELVVRSWGAALQGGRAGALESQHLLRSAFQANPKDRWIGFSLADQMLESLPQAVASGRDRRDALLEILAIRPDHVGALKALWRLEADAGDLKMAEYYREKIRSLSPLDKDAGSAE